MIEKIFLAILWCAPYLVSGFSAPFIFRHAQTLQQGGHYAGALFIFAGFWTLFLAYRHQYANSVKSFLIAVLCLQIIFWSWRFFTDLPLRASSLFGINGGAWHSMMTSLYVLVALILLYSEFRTRPA